MSVQLVLMVGRVQMHKSTNDHLKEHPQRTFRIQMVSALVQRLLYISATTP